MSLEYAAGLYDGEGTVSFRWNNYASRSIRLAIQMTEREPVEKFQAAIGLKKEIREYQRRSRPDDKPVYILEFQRFEQVQYVICLLWKHISQFRKDQYEKVAWMYLRSSR